MTQYAAQRPRNRRYEVLHGDTRCSPPCVVAPPIVVLTNGATTAGRAASRLRSTGLTVRGWQMIKPQPAGGLIHAPRGDNDALWFWQATAGDAWQRAFLLMTLPSPGPRGQECRAVSGESHPECTHDGHRNRGHAIGPAAKTLRGVPSSFFATKQGTRPWDIRTPRGAAIRGGVKKAARYAHGQTLLHGAASRRRNWSPSANLPSWRPTAVELLMARRVAKQRMAS